MLAELRHTLLPRHHRDVQDAAGWAADKIERLCEVNASLLAIAQTFLGEDDRFQVAVGGNPIAVDKMLEDARAVVSLVRRGL